MAEQRKDPRSLTTNYQERRRIAALEQQQSARSKAIESRRRFHDLALMSEEPQQGEEEEQSETTSSINHQEYDLRDTHISASTSSSVPKAKISEEEKHHQHQKELRQYWSSQLMNPEWLIEIPSDLAAEWYVLPRPEGQRCTVMASQGKTLARLRNGVIFENFQSGLPYGSRETTRGGGGQPHHCLLDCIYHAANDTYYILDMMIWRGRELYDCTTEFRFFWMHSKLEEEEANWTPPQTGATPNIQHISNCGGGASSSEKRRVFKQFVPLPAYPATSSGIQSAYSSNPVAFVQDGLYFIHRRTQYAPGQTPLALYWKDGISSRYFIETDAKGAVHPEQQVVLQYVDVPRRGVCTGDETPVPLGMMPEQFVESVKGKLKPGRLLKFSLGPGGVQFAAENIANFGIASGLQQQDMAQYSQPVGADLKFIGVANQRRGRADTLSKILFQMMARRQPITVDMLKAAANESERAAAVGAVGGGAEGLLESRQEGESIGVVLESRDHNNEDIMND